MEKRLLACGVLMAALIFTGCTKKVVKTDTGAGVENSAGKAEALKPDAAGGLKNGTVASSDLAAGNAGAGQAPAAKGFSDIFFDFDRYAIRDTDKPSLERDAALLKGDGNLKVVIEGRCDERGSDEYNLALGEKRAAAVKRYLSGLGIDPGRLSTISYGSEKPLCAGHDEDCWQKNRTAHFVTE